MNSGQRVVVLGVGNVLCSDDGAGPEAVRLLQNQRRLPACVELVDGGTIGLDLLPLVAGATHLLIIDAVDGGRAPADVFELDNLAGVPGGSNAHQLGIVDLLAALRLIDQAPEYFRVVAVQPADTMVGARLSPAVAAALPLLLETAVRQVAAWVK